MPTLVKKCQARLNTAGKSGNLGISGGETRDMKGEDMKPEADRSP